MDVGTSIVVATGFIAVLTKFLAEIRRWSVMLGKIATWLKKGRGPRPSQQP